MAKTRHAHRILAGKTEWKRSLGKPRRKVEDNIKMYLEETECECGYGMDSSGAG
jgi:hypothetical protein